MTNAHEDLECRLSQAFTREADAITPSDHLDEIRSAVSGQRRRGWVSWGVSLAAAAAVVAVALVAWVALGPRYAETPLPAGTPVPSDTATPPTVTSVVPVYLVVPPEAANGHYSLVRRLETVSVPVDAPGEAVVDRALQASLSMPWGFDEGRFVRAFDQHVSVVQVPSTGPEILVQVSGAGVSGLPTDAQRLAVQALVWTVTDDLQQPSAPVSVTVKDGGPLFETVAAGVFKRPADDRLGSELAPIWVDRPAIGAPYPTGQTVVVSGTACTFEQAFSWSLRDATHVLRQGTVTAGAASCPAERGNWSVDLGALASGDYEFTATITSAETGQISTTLVTGIGVH